MAPSEVTFALAAGIPGPAPASVQPAAISATHGACPCSLACCPTPERTPWLAWSGSLRRCAPLAVGGAGCSRCSSCKSHWAVAGQQLQGWRLSGAGVYAGTACFTACRLCGLPTLTALAALAASLLPQALSPHHLSCCGRPASALALMCPAVQADEVGESSDPDSAQPAEPRDPDQPQTSTSYNSAAQTEAAGGVGGLVRRQKSALRRYVESFDQETMLQTAR